MIRGYQPALFFCVLIACGSSNAVGEASDAGDPCGAATCGTGLYCKLPDAICIANGKDIGICEQIPEQCIMLFQPVCGCDGKTYSNACEAARSGISIRSLMECPS